MHLKGVNHSKAETVKGPGFRGLGCRDAQGLGFRVQGLGFRVYGPHHIRNEGPLHGYELGRGPK